MLDVAEHDEDEGSRGDDAIVGAAAPRPPFRRHASDQCQHRIADGNPLLEDVHKRPAFERSTWYVAVLVKPRKRRLIAAANPPLDSDRCPTTSVTLHLPGA